MSQPRSSGALTTSHAPASVNVTRRQEPISGPFAEGRPSTGTRRNHLTSPHLTSPHLTSLGGLLDNRNVGVVGVEDLREVPSRPRKYHPQLIRRHHRVIHPRANDVTKTYAYSYLTR